MLKFIIRLKSILAIKFRIESVVTLNNQLIISHEDLQKSVKFFLKKKKKAGHHISQSNGILKVLVAALGFLSPFKHIYIYIYRDF